MCERLSELREAMGCFASGFDADLLSVADASKVVRDASAIERMAAAVVALAAAREAQGRGWKDKGHRSAAQGLARERGSSVGRAAETLERGRRLRKLPETKAAAQRGELSAEQASAIGDAASADPAAEGRLLAMAGRVSLAELRDECARVKAAVEDLEERRKRIHERRSLRTWTDGEGAWHLHFRHNPEAGAEIMAALDPIRDRLFRQARAEGRREPLEAYGADALVELARGAGEGAGEGSGTDKPKPNGSAKAKVLVRVDLGTLLRGYPVGEECCEFVGFGPVAVSAIRDLLECGDPFLAAVVTKGVEVVGVAHLGRRPTAHQQSALEWLYPTCAVEGCGAVTFLENDHRIDWATSGVTIFDLLDRLCSAHHGLKTTEGWALVEGRGKRAFVPPDDPRHPRRAKAHGPPGEEAA